MSSKKLAWVSLILSALVLGSAPVAAQVRTVDPNDAIARDVSGAPSGGVQTDTRVSPSYDPAPAYEQPSGDPGRRNDPPADDRTQPAPSSQSRPPIPVSNTYHRDDIIAAAEGTFGKGAQGLAEIVERTLREQGEPNAYIAGSEAAGAIGVGLRYGKGLLSHRVEGQRPVYWTGPSIGFDLGGDATKVFVLVYNLYDSEELYRRFPAAEGRLYFIGGFAATYLRRGNMVLIPIRLGLGYRAGVNVGYMKFSKTSKWFPF